MIEALCDHLNVKPGLYMDEIIDRLGDIAYQVRNLECRKVCADQGVFADYHHSHSKCALPCEMP
jgi:delta8-fatty-acid desaturase